MLDPEAKIATVLSPHSGVGCMGLFGGYAVRCGFIFAAERIAHLPPRARGIRRR
ncbi:hypothetical protein [Kallotenue papyrolyticum]|uniref:hypothetical protein n=1 Tax=Kallotenue papyrolyticum TaxID=1325125 RepID=UPI001378E8D5|nr:hypothetical protein [Kallotenue papyrolyticum]